MKKKLEVTHIELQNVLGLELKEISRMDMTPEEREIALEHAHSITQLANQMINNGNFMLNAEKALAQNGSLDESIIKYLVGEIE